jgi:hypothetical protein
MAIVLVMSAGTGYFAKLSTAKALSEMPQVHVGG